jgi:hypothetical protein
MERGASRLRVEGRCEWRSRPKEDGSDLCSMHEGLAHFDGAQRSFFDFRSNIQVYAYLEGNGKYVYSCCDE